MPHHLTAADVARLQAAGATIGTAAVVLGMKKVWSKSMPKKKLKAAKPEPISVHVRWMIRRDMAEIQAIEEAAFQFPWTEEDFLRCLRQRNCIGMVAELKTSGNPVVGYMIYELHKSCLHVMNFAVCPKHRRQGVGTQLVLKLASKLSSHRRTRITLEVRETNLGAQRFFKAMLFQARRVLRGFYDDTGEDAYRFEMALGDVEPDWPVNRIEKFLETGK